MGNKPTETLKERTARGLFWSALNNGAMQLLNIVIGVFLARLLSASDYGLVGMLAVFTALAGALQESGFTSALTNLKRPTSNDYNAVFWFSVLVSCVSYGLLFFSAPLIAGFFQHPELTQLSRFLFISLFFSAIGTAPNAYVFKNMIVKEVTILRVSSLCFSGIVGVVLALKGYAYWSLAWQQITFIAVMNVGRFFLIDWRPTLHIDFRPIRRMFAFSYKILLTTIVNVFSQNILTFIFARLYPVATVGNFTQAFKWQTMASGLVTGTISQVAQPILVEVNNDRERQVSVFRKLLRFTSFLAFPAMFALAMVSHEFIVILLSEKWLDSIPMLRLLAIGGAFLPFYAIYQNLIISRGKSAIYLWCTLCLIALQVLSILVFHAEGMLFIVRIYTFLVISWLLVWQYFAWRAIGVKLHHVLKDVFPYLLLSALVMFGVYWVTQSIENLLLLLFVRLSLAFTLYLVLLRLMGAKMLNECLGYLKKKRK